MTLSRPEEVVLDAVERFGEERLALAASWQKETAVLVDVVRRHAPAARIFTLDTGVLFEQTYATWRTVEERYGITVEDNEITEDNFGSLAGLVRFVSSKRVAAV